MKADYRVRLATNARADILSMMASAAVYSGSAAERHGERLSLALAGIGQRPLAWSHFFLTGPPYRGRLFLMGRTSLWIVYRMRTDERAVDVLRVWNSRQDPEDFEI